jgi:hypothetical protein
MRNFVAEKLDSPSISIEMASPRLGADNTGDSGMLFKIIVHLCGVAAVVGIFFPFIDDHNIIELFNQIRYSGFGSLGGKTVMGTITNAVIYSGFLLYPLIGIIMAIRGKYEGGPFTFLIVHNLLALLLLLIFGSVTNNLTGVFFAHTGLGYWISCGGLGFPFVAMFFADKSI